MIMKTRRDFLKMSAAVGAGLFLPSVKASTKKEYVTPVIQPITQCTPCNKSPEGLIPKTGAVLYRSNIHPSKLNSVVRIHGQCVDSSLLSVYLQDDALDGGWFNYYRRTRIDGCCACSDFTRLLNDPKRNGWGHWYHDPSDGRGTWIDMSQRKVNMLSDGSPGSYEADDTHPLFYVTRVYYPERERTDHIMMDGCEFVLFVECSGCEKHMVLSRYCIDGEYKTSDSFKLHGDASSYLLSTYFRRDMQASGIRVLGVEKHYSGEYNSEQWATMRKWTFPNWTESPIKDAIYNGVTRDCQLAVPYAIAENGMKYSNSLVTSGYAG
jgi:hypothetical protein